MKIGIGYDVHKIVEDRKLYLGGIEIPWDKGLLGHSDADVLIHTIMDSILGALALGDIGKHFPDTDPKYKGIRSTELLEHVMKLVWEKGYEIGNIDSIVVCQEPKLKDYILPMRESLAFLMDTDIDNVSVKATTTEKLGFEGRKEGISSHCVVLLNKRS
ncbi:MAG: 2-C-methyl-D-erythritol 2,4-cyclodiphosphate synthase [Firmicutes bacterium]|jgi:2-C-methyl-D-erythritol 2,4-cyclodiphosphate synthase|nr:2-C-methyl-D-erythritol 2,4-cyclodiphosphate synthase [Bacillota bacterium]